jgi:hypothetical protein
VWCRRETWLLRVRCKQWKMRGVCQWDKIAEPMKQFCGMRRWKKEETGDATAREAADEVVRPVLVGGVVEEIE